jgi:hypothetical protein
MATKINRGSKNTIFNPKDDLGLDKPGYSDQYAYRSGNLPSKSKAWQERPSRYSDGIGGAYSKDEIAWADGSDLIKAAAADLNMYGGPGRGDVANKPKTGNAPRNDRGSPTPHVYNEDEDFGM